MPCNSAATRTHSHHEVTTLARCNNTTGLVTGTGSLTSAVQATLSVGVSNVRAPCQERRVRREYEAADRPTDGLLAAHPGGLHGRHSHPEVLLSKLVVDFLVGKGLTS